jgi:hypothetical protein
LLKAASSRPYVLSVHLHEPLDGRGVGHVGRNGKGASASRRDLLRAGRQHRLVARGQHDGRACRREGAGRGGADATARTGDDRDLAGEQSVSGHRHSERR